MTEEKRRYMRYNVFLKPLECSKCDSKEVDVDISDISCTGLGIATTERVVRGDTVELEIIIPEDDIPMFVVGEVTWVTRHPAIEDAYSAGLKLTKISACDKDRLFKYIDVSFLRPK